VGPAWPCVFDAVRFEAVTPVSGLRHTEEKIVAEGCYRIQCPEGSWSDDATPGWDTSCDSKGLRRRLGRTEKKRLRQGGQRYAGTRASRKNQLFQRCTTSREIRCRSKLPQRSQCASSESLTATFIAEKRFWHFVQRHGQIPNALTTCSLTPLRLDRRHLSLRQTGHSKMAPRLDPTRSKTRAYAKMFRVAIVRA
jgi:hypothetical protein